MCNDEEFTDTLLSEYETYLHGYCSQVELTQISSVYLHNTVIKEEMVDTPVAVMSIKRARESKCTNTEYNIVYVLNNIMVMTCRCT